ncbi:hypothetical protein Airi02_094600 [Actinoallomurus iriomotensis]|uniref:Uncharacterized protein n=1 Tax=Actinoallomurus iriomotensis TaxID=478107 RepID=A0A9W6SEV8_9ACTN|nr:hypothetical protein Airi02_094600 [Actinoallomurus iriomotensis]
MRLLELGPEPVDGVRQSGGTLDPGAVVVVRDAHVTAFEVIVCARTDTHSSGSRAAEGGPNLVSGVVADTKQDPATRSAREPCTIS